MLSCRFIGLNSLHRVQDNISLRVLFNFDNVACKVIADLFILLDDSFAVELMLQVVIIDIVLSEFELLLSSHFFDERVK